MNKLVEEALSRFVEQFTYKPSGRWWTKDYGKEVPGPEEVKDFIRTELTKMYKEARIAMIEEHAGKALANAYRKVISNKLSKEEV